MSGIWDGLTGIFDAVTNFDFTSMVPDWIMDFIGDDKKEAFAAAQEKASKQTGIDLNKAGVSKQNAQMVSKVIDQAKRDEGGDELADNSEVYEKKLKSMIVDSKRMSSEQNEAVMNAFKNGGYGFKGSKIYQEVAKAVGGNVDTSNAAHRKIIMDKLKKVKADEYVGDDINDDYDESLRLLGVAAAKQQYDSRINNRGVAALIRGMTKAGGVNLGDEFFSFAGNSVVTKSMIQSLEAIYNDANPNIALLRTALQRVNVTPNKLTSMLESTQATEEPVAVKEPTKGPVAMDFISRPGQEPLLFDKGDIVMGIHSDTPPVAPAARKSAGSTDNSGALVEHSREMVVKLNGIMDIMNRHSEIHGQVLEVLTEAGLVDKQGNTVVNNGGNSSVTNNVTQQSNIMDFRDKVIGRMNNSSTKYT